MATIVNSRYPGGTPDYMAFAVSVEDQKSAGSRLPHLSRLKGRQVIAIEPMLGPLTLAPHLSTADWVVAGLETGAGARPLDLDWIRNLRDEVKAAGLPFFIKQLGTNHKESIGTSMDSNGTSFHRGWRSEYTNKDGYQTQSREIKIEPVRISIQVLF
jgi:protein gp37